MQETMAGQKNVLYVEHYLFYDLDGDGIDERIKSMYCGQWLKYSKYSSWDDLPITLFCPDPEPHTSIGSCPADYLKPIQALSLKLCETHLIVWATPSSLAWESLKGQVNIDDVLNTDIGQPLE